MNPDETTKALPRYTLSDGEGPICPFCERQFTADESHYFDEVGFEIECDECGNEIKILPQILTSWRTIPIAFANKP